MSETYQIFIRPGFSGSSEGHEYVQKATKRIGQKPVMAYGRNEWIDYAMYPCESKSKVKRAIIEIIKAGNSFWANKKDLFISINDNTKEFFKSGNYETNVNPSESDWENFVLVEIKSGTKKPIKPKARAQKSVVATTSSIKSVLSTKELLSAASSGMYWGKKK